VKNICLGYATHTGRSHAMYAHARIDRKDTLRFPSWGCGLSLGGRHTYQLCSCRCICSGYRIERSEE